MSEKMGTTVILLTEGEPQLSGTEQVKHTPGPWRLRKMSYGYDLTLPSQATPGGYGGWFVELHGLEPDPQKWDPEFEGNARLIAAAPDMLAALKESHRALTHYEWYASGSVPSALRVANEAAIAKAEGRTP